MKTDLNTFKKDLLKRDFKKEFSKFTDMTYLKKEINRVTKELRGFDLKVNVNSEAREALKQIEDRFRDIVHSLNTLQKQFDANVEKFIQIVRQKAGRPVSSPTRKSTRKSTRTKSSAKSSKPNSTASKKSARRAAPKTSRKSTSRKMASPKSAK